MHVERAFSTAGRASSDARQFISTEFDRMVLTVDRDVSGDLELIVTELVTNATRAGSATVIVALGLHRDTVQVGVTDQAPGIPTMQPFSASMNHGRGLRLIDGLATAWGCTDVEDGKQVWAVLAVPAQSVGPMTCTR